MLLGGTLVPSESPPPLGDGPRVPPTTMTRLHYLCQPCFDRYADIVKGNVQLAIEFEAESPHECVCGEPVQAGAAFAVHSEHYDNALEGAPVLSIVSHPPERPIDDTFQPTLVYENAELRVVIDGGFFVMETARLDAMKEIAWESKTRCRITGDDMDSRCGRAISQLVDQVAVFEAEEKRLDKLDPIDVANQEAL